MNKICSKCNKEKDIKLFYSAPQCLNGVRPECRSCTCIGRIKRQKVQKEIDPDRRYNVVLKNKYGITFQLYKLMLEDQGNACLICKSTKPSKKNRYFCVDHCHKTGRIRGLLCYDCNVAIGLFKENQQSLLAAVDYLNGVL